MPNNVVSELVFTGIDNDMQYSILGKVVNKEGYIDFEILLPPPLNIWMGNVGERHEKRFPGNMLDWSRSNWGTKWNAYGLRDEVYKPIVQTEDSLTLTFQTAWAPPMGWIVALFNLFKISFDHNWLDEGEAIGHSDKFIAEAADKDFAEPWVESPADDKMQKHLHYLLWGCEAFEEEGA